MFLVLWIFLQALVPTLVGHVTDRAEKPVAGAVVRAITANGPASETRTDDKGAFRIQSGGTFQLEISYPAHRTVRTSDILLGSGDVYQIDDISLLPGNTDDIERVDLQIDEPEELLAREAPGAREGLPKADRLFGLRGGINMTGIAEGSGQQWVAASGNVFTSSFAGFSENRDFSAELGGASGYDDALPAGQTVAHGSAYYFHRNDYFNARNYFDPHNAPIPPFKYHFFGGDAGGRLREGTYLYSQYWGLRIRQSVTRAATVPDPAWLQGDFSSVPEAIADPETGFPFAGNRIPANRFHPLGLTLARMYPAPNVPGATIQNYRAVEKLSTAADSFGFRIDQRVSSSDEAFLEYQFNRDTTDDPFNLLSGITNLPSFGVRDALETHSARLRNTHIFSAAVIHQLGFSLNYLKQPRTILQPAGTPNPIPGPAVLMTGLSNLGYAANLPQQRIERSFEILNDISWQHAGSTTKLGGDFRYFQFHAALDLYARGQFQFTGGIFSDPCRTGGILSDPECGVVEAVRVQGANPYPLANLLLGLPTNALRLQGDTSRNFQTRTMSAYIQHEWRPFARLSLNAGLRHQYQSPFREANGLAANFDAASGTLRTSSQGLYRSDRNNVAPRLGLAWLTAANIMVRAGYGIFYDTLAVGDSLFLLGLNPPYVRFELQNNGPNAPEFDLGTVFQGNSMAFPLSIFSTSPDMPNPYVQQWNLSLQRSLAQNLGVELSYFGQKGTRLRRQLNLNQPSPGPAGTLDERRPYPDFRNIFQFETSASSIGHGLEARLVRGLRADLNFTAAYRFGRWIDDATLISVLPQDSHNLRAERGLADFQVRHQLTFSGAYNLPLLPVPGARGFTRGWQLQAAGIVQSGMPLSAILGADYAGTGSPIVNRPDLIRNPNISGDSPSHFFDPAAFQIPERERFGNSGRNVISGPGVWNVDLGLTRTARLSDFTRVQFRADFYNVFNHHNFVPPPSTQNFADSPDFGALFVARSPRILQFGLKFLR